MLALVSGLVLLGVAEWLTRQQRLVAARLITLSVLLGELTVVLFRNENGIHSVAVMLLPSVIVVASLLLGRRGFVIMTMLTIASAASVIVCDITGIRPTRFHETAAYRSAQWLHDSSSRTSIAASPRHGVRTRCWPRPAATSPSRPPR
jgi:hypothetical protein